MNGPTVSEYYGLIRLPKGLRLPYNLSFRVCLPAPGPIVGIPMYRPSPGTHRASQVPDASLHTCHALCGPRQSLGELTKALSLCWLLEPLRHRRLHYPLYRGCIKTLGSAVSLAAYVVPWVRFSCFVRSCDLLHNCNPRCGWLVRPYPTGTSTLQETPSLLGAQRPRAELPALMTLRSERLAPIRSLPWSAPASCWAALAYRVTKPICLGRFCSRCLLRNSE